MRLDPLDGIVRKSTGRRYGHHLNTRLTPQAHLFLDYHYIGEIDARAQPMPALDNNPLPSCPR